MKGNPFTHTFVRDARLMVLERLHFNRHGTVTFHSTTHCSGHSDQTQSAGPSAATSLSELRCAQPVGPYSVAGWRFPVLGDPPPQEVDRSSRWDRRPLSRATLARTSFAVQKVTFWTTCHLKGLLHLWHRNPRQKTVFGGQKRLANATIHCFLCEESPWNLGLLGAVKRGQSVRPSVSAVSVEMHDVEVPR